MAGKICHSFNRHTPLTKFWNYIRKFKRIYYYVNNGNVYRNDEWINDFINKLSQADIPELDNIQMYFNNNNNLNNNFY